MKKGFTLVEMLVVIGILGILMAVLIGSFSGGTESARAAKCLTNMKNLASACQTYGMATGHFPYAGSSEWMNVSANTRSSGGSRVTKTYGENAGWISWFSNQAYSGGATSHVASPSWYTSAYSDDPNAREYCLTNGALWKYVSANRELYVCPEHKIKFAHNLPAWSYVMSSRFRWGGANADAKGSGSSGIGFADLKRADRVLLFAELPYVEDGVTTIDISSGPGTKCDCVLQYSSSDGVEKECIGFNHKSGKKNLCAHVVFADGHTEKLAWPRSGFSKSKMQELTEWLCKGEDFSFDGKEYKKFQ